MIDKKKLLAVIPARGGSKRLPRKNILDLGGKPLISWTIEAALGVKYIDRVIVSTDDKEIADISKKYGADVPFMRPDELATDKAISTDVVLSLLRQLEKNDEYYDYVILLQPTSPLRSCEDIEGAIEQLIDKNNNAVVSVCKSEHSPLWMNLLPEDKSMVNFIDDSLQDTRSEDLPSYYRLNGAVYLIKTNTLLNTKYPTFYPNENISAYIMPSNRSIDIDNIDDFNMAEMLLDYSKRCE